MKDVLVDVGQYSRESGRVPVSVLQERLESERKMLVTEMQDIEARLSDIASQKADELSHIYRRRMRKSDAIAATNEVTAKFNKARSKLIRDKSGIEERLHDIKRRMSATADVREDVKVLLRIEVLLQEILEKVSKN